MTWPLPHIYVLRGTGENLYAISTSGLLTGERFATVTNLPEGYSVEYAFNDRNSSNNIVLKRGNMVSSDGFKSE